MKIGYMMEMNKEDGIKKKIQYMLFNIFTKEKVQRIENKWIVEIRNQEKGKKIDSLDLLLKKYRIETLVLEEKLDKNQEFKNKLYSKGYTILNGKKFMKCGIIKILEFISKQMEILVKEQDVSILINDMGRIEEYYIEEIAKLVRSITIITNHTNKFRVVEEKLYDEFGIVLNINNNKRKGLTKAKVIINFDFPEEIIKQYRIARNAIIINLKQNLKIASKRFEGILINDWKVTFKEDSFNNMPKKEVFNPNYLYESELIQIPFSAKVEEKMEKDQIEINYLIGKNGKISKQDFQLIKK